LVFVLIGGAYAAWSSDVWWSHRRAWPATAGRQLAM